MSPSINTCVCSASNVPPPPEELRDRAHAVSFRDGDGHLPLILSKHAHRGDGGDRESADRISECPVKWTRRVWLTSHPFNEILGRRMRCWQINRWGLTHNTIKYCREKECAQNSGCSELTNVKRLCHRGTFQVHVDDWRIESLRQESRPPTLLTSHSLCTHYCPRADWQINGAVCVSFNASFN